MLGQNLKGLGLDGFLIRRGKGFGLLLEVRNVECSFDWRPSHLRNNGAREAPADKTDGTSKAYDEQQVFTNP